MNQIEKLKIQEQKCRQEAREQDTCSLFESITSRINEGRDKKNQIIISSKELNKAIKEYCIDYPEDEIIAR